MNRTTLPINEILVEARQRQDLGDIQGLADSLTRYGLIQPIVVNSANRLIAGGRRLAAASLLGWTSIDVVYKETLSDDVLHEMELEENIRRKDMDWRERVLAVAQIHEIKQRQAALDSTSWGQRETGELLGETMANVNYTLIIARRLKLELAPDGKTFLPDAKYAKCENFATAWRLRQTEEIDALQAQLAQEHLSSAPVSSEPSLLAEILSDESNPNNTQDIDTLTYESAKERYLRNPHNDPAKFDEYWKYHQELTAERENTIHLSKRLLLGDSITYMSDPANAGTYDHVITDIPYAIDIDMIDQQKGIQDIDTVREEHDVDYNLKLIQDFFPAAFKVTKDKAFVVTWCDYWIWRWMADLALKAGFVVQRWPNHWVKPTGLNQCADYNFTKNTEAVLICRKQGTTLVAKQSTCCVHAQKDELCAAIDHPFAKPFDAWKYLIEAVSLEGQVLLDPFAGRGSGVISMLRLRRHAVGIELQQNHYNYLLENVKQYYRALNPNYIFK